MKAPDGLREDEMSPELIKSQAAIAARMKGLEKARAAKALKATERRDELKITNKREYTREQEVWLEVFLNYMKSSQLKGSKDVHTLINWTNETIEILHNAGKL